MITRNNILIACPVVAVILVSSFVYFGIDTNVWTVAVMTFLGISFIRALTVGTPMSTDFLERDKIFQIRAEYHNERGTFLMIDFGNGKVETVFQEDLQMPEVRVGRFYVWNGETLDSAVKN